MPKAPDIKIKEDFIKGMPESWRVWRVIVDGNQIRSFDREEGGKEAARKWADELYWAVMKTRKIQERGRTL